MLRSAVTVCLLALCLGASTKPATRAAMDYGPFLSYSIIAPWEGDKTKKTDLALKGISIKLDEQHTICFDTDLMRWAGAWKGGFLDLSQTHQNLLKGTHPPSAEGQLLFATPMTPGVSRTTDLADPRPDHMGPLPREFAHYNGVYINGGKIILSYSVGDAQVLESPALDEIQFHVTGTKSVNFQSIPIKRTAN